MNKPLITENVNNLYSVLKIITDNMQVASSTLVEFKHIFNESIDTYTNVINVKFPISKPGRDYVARLYLNFYFSLPCKIMEYIDADVHESVYSLLGLISLLESEYYVKSLEQYTESGSTVELLDFKEIDLIDSDCTDGYVTNNDIVADSEIVAEKLYEFFSNSHIKAIPSYVFDESLFYCHRK